MTSHPQLPPRLRFAPSPNGYLHVGHAFSALENMRVADAIGGETLLRIEDIDTARCNRTYENALFEDLRWIGYRWPEPVVRQSLRFEAYRATADDLLARGLAYPCYATRGDIHAWVRDYEFSGKSWPRDPDGAPVYPGLWRDADVDARRRGQPYAIRLNMDKAVAATGIGSVTWSEWTGQPNDTPQDVSEDPRVWGDAVLIRKDTPASYHLSCVLDDDAQSVTHIVRGRDLYHATSFQRLLQTLLGLDPPVYVHHRLILDSAGRKLSKSTGATSLRDMRSAGFKPADLAQFFADTQVTA